MQTLIVQPESSDKLEAVKAVLKALKVKFVAQDAPEGENFYSDEFEDKMKRAEADKKAGRFKAIKTADLWK